MEVDRGTADFHVLHATAWASSPICSRSQSFRTLFSHFLLNPKKEESIEYDYI